MTAAILPDHIIPYGTYGIFFVLRVLSEHFFGFRSISAICERYDISEKLFHKWKSLFLNHKSRWLGKLDDTRKSPAAFMKELLLNPYSDFASEFISRFSFSFLQSHQNPKVRLKNTAEYCQKVFTPDYIVT